MGRNNNAKALRMRNPSLYLDWYNHIPKVKYDLRSSGISGFKFDLSLGKVDLSESFAHGNPKAVELLAKRYRVQSENVFFLSEGTSGQNARVIRYLSEKEKNRNEAIVEYPTYEPLLRQVQEHFPVVKRLEREENDGYRLDPDQLREVVSEKTRLLVLTNPHLPTGALSDTDDLKEIMTVAKEYSFLVLVDEVYAEFKRDAVPTAFSVDPDFGIVTTSFTKGYGLGGLRAGITLATRELVDDLYFDALNTVGSSSNLVEMATLKLLAEGAEALEEHKQKWFELKSETERLLNENELQYSPNNISVTYWVKLPIKDTYKWVNEHAMPKFNLATVPGSFFLFKNGQKLETSNMIRLGLGSLEPKKSSVQETFQVFLKALNV
jgi:aspartate/methionine/tyrosine aminotransferase